MVQDLQRTLQRKNVAIEELQSKNKGLKRVMQPRMAYKYAPRESSTTELINMNAQSQYAFSGRKASNGAVGRQEVLNMYQKNRRAKSIATGAVGNSDIPAAAPSSGTGGYMFNDSSATQFKAADGRDEIYVVQANTG